MATVIFHASTFDFFLAVLGLADSLGSGEPGGSVGGQGALSTSGSGSRGIEGLLETPENNTCDKEGCTEKCSRGYKVATQKGCISSETLKAFCCHQFTQHYLDFLSREETEAENNKSGGFLLHIFLP